MTLEEYMQEYDFSPEQIAPMFNVTPRVILRWMKEGIPRSRQGEVLAKTNGRVTFRDMPTFEEHVLSYIQRAQLQLEHLRVRAITREARIEIQNVLDDLTFARHLIETNPAPEIML